MKAEKPGESIQIDHMSVSFGDGFVLEAFKATCPLTATTIMRAYRRASSRNARRLFVSPPKKPKYNGCLARANGTTRYAFYPF